MCSWWQTAGVSAIAAMTSSVNSRGCGLVNRIRSRPSIRPAARSRSAKAPPVAELDAVGVHVLAEQGHLEHALVDQRLHLGQDLAGTAVLLLAAQRRDDAERAGVVAADADRHPAGVGGVALGGQGRREDLEGLDDLHLRLGVVPGAVEQRRQRATLCVPKTTSTHGARRTISPRSFCARQPPTAICMPGWASLTGAQVAEVAVEPVVGVLPDRAGVEDDDVGVVALRRGGVAGVLQQPGRAARSRARSSGTRRCAPGRCAAARSTGFPCRCRGYGAPETGSGRETGRYGAPAGVTSGLARNGTGRAAPQPDPPVTDGAPGRSAPFSAARLRAHHGDNARRRAAQVAARSPERDRARPATGRHRAALRRAAAVSGDRLRSRRRRGECGGPGGCSAGPSSAVPVPGGTPLLRRGPDRSHLPRPRGRTRRPGADGLRPADPALAGRRSGPEAGVAGPGRGCSGRRRGGRHRLARPA